MLRISTRFGVDSSSRFSLRAWTYEYTRTKVKDVADNSTHARIVYGLRG